MPPEITRYRDLSSLDTRESDATLERQYSGEGWQTVEDAVDGGALFAGFQVYLANPAGWDSDGGNVPYDGISFDTDGYWSVDDAFATIPEGKAGLYLVSHFSYVADVATLDGVQGIVPNTGTPDPWQNGFDHVFTKALNAGGIAKWDDGMTWYGRFGEGDQIGFTIGWHPFSIPSINIGGASYLTAILLGNPDA